MSKPDLERAAHTVECFMNALRVPDGPKRTAVEEMLTRWLGGPVRGKTDCIVYHAAKVDCYLGGRPMKTYELPGVAELRTIWSDGTHIIVIDGEAFRSTRSLIALEDQELDFSMPETPVAG